MPLLLRFLSLLACLLLPLPLAAHPVSPANASFERQGDTLLFDVSANLEGFVAGIDLTLTADTNTSGQSSSYDSLRALPPQALESRFRAFWPRMASRIFVRVDGVDQPLTLLGVSVAEVGDTTLPRNSTFTFSAPLPAGAQKVQIGWASTFGGLVLQQTGVDAPFSAYLDSGAMSDPIALVGGSAMSPVQALASYIPLGFSHILPQGLDHILFVLGLFFLSTRLKPLLWQVSTFTLAHTVTLGLGAMGYASVPSAIVEPLIAASITFVAVENILSRGLSPWRPAVVFGFGLLHGLGFASVLMEIGLPKDAFFPALIGFNVGVELGQLAILAAAFLCVGLWFRNKPWYRDRISTPASGAIALVGAFWFVQRAFF